MGCSGVNVKSEGELIKEYKSKQFFNAYLSIENVLFKKIYPENYKSNEKVYLISTKSILNFIKILNDNNIFEDFHDRFLENKNLNIEKEKKLKEEFKNFSLRQVIPIIYSNYPDCKEIFEKQENNEFIIVDGDFIRNFKISDTKFKYVNIVNIIKIEEYYLITIKFPITEELIIAKEKVDKAGFFEFIELEENIENNENNNEEPKEELIIEDGENEEEEKRFESMMKSICYCLINIDSLKNYFYRIEFKIKEDNNPIHKIFCEMKQQNNDNEYFSNLISNLIKIINKDTLINIINNVYNKLHEEELVLENSDIKEMFYFKITNAESKCQNCDMIISQNNFFYKSIEFSLKAILNFKKGKNQLNILDCFDFWSNYSCPNCKIQINNFYRMEPNNEILTIILDRGDNFEDDIDFHLDYDINLDKYIGENSKIKCEYKFELKGFLCYYPDKKEFYSFIKNANNWDCFNGANINQFNNNDKENLGLPVLLLYKIEKKKYNKY